MKKILSFTLALCLSLCSVFVLVSCNEENETESTEALKTDPATEPVSESTEAPTAQIEGIVIPGPLMLLQSGGTYTRSYENHIWSQNWSEKSGWVCVDGTRMSMLYPSVQIRIPRIDYSNNFEFHFKENITSVYFTVYDTNFEKVKQGETKDALKDLSDGTYYLVVEVTKQDEYVESEKQYETSGYECVYKMKVGD